MNDDNRVNNDINFLLNQCYYLCSEIGGICTDDLKCICKEGYSTDFRDENFCFCNYKQYNKYITGTIELFLGFGFGHFYCKRYLNGYIQLCIDFLICCLMACLINIYIRLDIIFNNGNPYYTYLISNYYFPLLAISLVSWQIIDSILFLCSFYKDGNGIDLY